jgi:peptide methionine sulfoxide reductase MsrB
VTGPPPHIREIEAHLNNHFTEAKDEKSYTDDKHAGWYKCDYCGHKLYYSRRKPRAAAQHYRDCDEQETREP